MQSDHADALAALNHALFGEPSSEFPSGQFPTGLVQKIGYLQMVVQMLAKESEQQEQIGSLVDQVLVAARSLFLDQQRNAGNSAAVLQPMGSAVNPKQEEESVFPDSGLETYELIELDAMEILAEHTHFCEVCGKGFKRDANLRMHMRGHGDEYKTPAALARPKNSDGRVSRQKRYSCPYVGCKRNRHHKKFVPLKTVLCVKNHYRRSHCPKLLQCTRCLVKRFAVLADLKTHEKHCGREKWQCSCGTTFSRKDKLLGHIGLFVGHKPLMTQPVTVSASSSSNSYSDLLEELNVGIVGSSFEVDGILGDSLGINGKNGEQTCWGSQGLADMLAGNSDNMFVGDPGDNVLHDHGGGFSFLN